MESAMKIGVAADHGGYALKGLVMKTLHQRGMQIRDFGADVLNPADDYPDFVIPLAQAVAEGDFSRGIAICGSGVGACVAANKVPGVRAALITDCYSARQGVEDDNMNIICLGGRVTGEALALQIVDMFLNARFKSPARYLRRLEKIAAVERPRGSSEGPPHSLSGWRH